jgi:hypothetical protein
MHHALQVGEILHLIFGFVWHDTKETIRHRHATLVTLAVTCRAFQETALDAIWHTQIDMVSLMQFLPEESYESNDLDHWKVSCKTFSRYPVHRV